ncbi:hypothetical protein [Microcoleus sp. F4-D5]|uniref:hypothetical protein n=1 Tax=Microcoleus sp. F4-D5 TaxID=2818760 RepID=UPI002FCE99FC
MPDGNPNINEHFVRHPSNYKLRVKLVANWTECVAKIGRSRWHFLPSNPFLWINWRLKFCLLLCPLGRHKRRVMPSLPSIVNNQLLIVSLP